LHTGRRLLSLGLLALTFTLSLPLPALARTTLAAALPAAPSTTGATGSRAGCLGHGYRFRRLEVLLFVPLYATAAPTVTCFAAGCGFLLSLPLFELIDELVDILLFLRLLGHGVTGPQTGIAVLAAAP
jgi:hypothetical protein